MALPLWKRLNRSSGMPETPHYRMVPKGVEANLAFRRKVLRLGSQSRREADGLWRMCAEDPLFWLNTFGFVYRGNMAQTWPFITWPFQDKAILRLVASIGRRDVRVMKSRDMGWSYMATYIPTWVCQFHMECAWLFCSYKEDAVDRPKDPDCLFWKVDFCLRHQPGWLVGPVDRAHLRVYFGDTDSMIQGTATTRTISTGGRRLGVTCDELAKWTPQEVAHAAVRETQAVTMTRWFPSTPRGAHSAHALLKNSKTCEMLENHWSEHPEKAAGLYRVSPDGSAEVLDKDWHAANPGYAFRSEPGHWKGLRSPWYDVERDRASVPEDVYQEQDMDELGSGFQFFDAAGMDELYARNVREPSVVGDLAFDPDTGAFGSFEERADGCLRVWMDLDEDGLPPKGDYVVGADTAQGTGASPSVLCAGDAATGRQVAEFADNRLRPDQFATYAVALANWLGGAKIVPERNGPGEGFIHRAVELGWRNFYWQRQEDRLSRPVADKVGIWNQGGTRTRLFEELRSALRDGSLRMASAAFYEEAAEYVYAAGQKIEHGGALGSQNPSDSGASHGDRVVGALMMWWGMRHRAAEKEREPEPEPPRNSPKGRYLARLRRMLDDGEEVGEDSWRTR